CPRLRERQLHDSGGHGLLPVRGSLMADTLISTEAKRTLLDHMMTHVGAVTVKLFKNDYTPVAGSVASNFTVADYAGYTNQSVSFGGATSDGTGKAQALSDSIGFPLASSGSQTVYGWFMVDSSGKLLDARRLDSPVTVTTTAGVSPFRIL